MCYRDYGSARVAVGLSALVCALYPTATALAAAVQSGPAAIDAGPVAITPTLGMEAKHRDNIYLQETGEVDSWIFLLRPEIVARIQDRNNYYSLSYRGEASWYEESSRDDDNGYFDNTFAGDAHMELSDRWIATAYVSWADLHEDRGTGLSEGAIGEALPEPIQYEQTDIGGSLQYGAAGNSRLKVDAGYLEKRYQNFRNFTRSRDQDVTSAGATFFYPVAPKTDVLVDYSYKDISYPNPFEQIPPLDSEEHSLQVGAEWEITSQLTSTAQIGYVDKTFADPARADWDGVGWSLELWMQPRERDTIMVRGSRSPEETTLQGDFILSERLMTEWTHNWSDRINSRLSASVGRQRYRESLNDRDDYIYNATFRVGYDFRRWAQMYAGYSYDDKDSNIDGLSYVDHTFIFGLDLSL